MQWVFPLEGTKMPDLTQDQEELLLSIYSELPGSDPDLSREEKVQTALDAVLSSVEASREEEPTEVGTPVSASAIKEAMQQLTDPDLSSSDFEYQERKFDIPVEITLPNLEELLALDPDNEMLKAAIASEDAVTKEATLIVFRQIPDWKDKVKMERLVAGVRSTLINRQG